MSKINFKDIMGLLSGEDLATKIKGLSLLSEVQDSNCKQVPREVVEKVISVLKTSEKKPLTISSLTTLAHFSKFENLRLTISEADGVLAITPSLNANDASTVKTAVKVMSELAVGEKNQQMLIKEGGVVPLIGIIQRDNKDSKKLAMQIVSELINCVPGDLMEERILQSLFVLLSSPNEETLQWAAKAMLDLASKGADIPLKLCEFGLVEYLIVLTHHKSSNVAGNTYQSLEYVTRHVENIKKWAGEFNGVETYLTHLKEQKCERKVILQLLYNITKEVWDTKEEIAEDGEVKQTRTQRVALQESKEEFLKRDGVLLLLNLVVGNEDVAIKQLCIDIIGNLSVGALTLKVLETHLEKKKLTDMLLDLLIDLKTSEALRKSVIDTMSSFAKDEECVKRLVEMEVLSKLLAMLKGKVLILVVVELFASLNEHQSFQKQIFESGGLVGIVEMLESKESTEREAGLRAMVPFTKSPNGRIVLQQLGVISKLKVLEKDSNLIIVALAKATYKAIFKEGDSAFRLGLNTKTPFSFDYDEISRIDTELVAKCQDAIRKKLGKKKLRVQINWRQIERIEKEEDKESAMALLSNEEVWREFIGAVELYCHSEETIHSFDSNITMIMVDVTNEASINIEDMLMTYTLPFSGLLMSPKLIAGTISYQLLGRDVTEEMEDIDDKYYQAVEEMKKVAKDPSIPMLGDINILYFHMTLHIDRLYKESFVDSQAIIVAKKEVLDADELFMKGWKITHLSEKGYKQARLLLLTNCNLYVVAYDYSGKKVDYSGTQIHPLDDFDSVDIGLLKSKNPTEEELTVESRQYAFSLFMIDREKELQQTKIQVRESDFAIKKPGQVQQEEENKRKSQRKSLLGDMMKGFSESFRLKNDGKVGEIEDDLGSSDGKSETGVGEVQDAERNLTGLDRYIFTVTEDTVRSKQKLLVDEIAWMIWAAAGAYKRRQLDVPHYEDIEKPSTGLLSNIYNALGLGGTGQKQKEGREESKRNSFLGTSITPSSLKPSLSKKF